MIYVEGQPVVTIEHCQGYWWLCEHVDGTFAITHWQEIAVVCS